MIHAIYGDPEEIDRRDSQTRRQPVFPRSLFTQTSLVAPNFSLLITLQYTYKYVYVFNE